MPQPSPGPAATPSLTLSVSSPTPCGEVSRSDSESSAAVRPGSNPDSASCPPACMGAQGGKSVGGLGLELGLGLGPYISYSSPSYILGLGLG